MTGADATVMMIPAKMVLKSPITPSLSRSGMMNGVGDPLRQMQNDFPKKDHDKPCPDDPILEIGQEHPKNNSQNKGSDKDRAHELKHHRPLSQRDTTTPTR